MGFTLIEIAVVLGIISILAAVAIASLMDMTKRSTFSSASGDVLTGIRRTQQEATGRGVYTAFVIDTNTGKWWGIATDSSFSLASFDPANPGEVIVSGTLPSSGNNVVSFGPSAGFGKTLPAPFDTVPVVSSQSPNLPFCSFCDSASRRGSVLFEPGGNRVRFNGATSGLGQQFTLNWSYKNMSDKLVIAIIERTGLIESFAQ